MFTFINNIHRKRIQYIKEAQQLNVDANLYDVESFDEFNCHEGIMKKEQTHKKITFIDNSFRGCIQYIEEEQQLNVDTDLFDELSLHEFYRHEDITDTIKKEHSDCENKSLIFQKIEIQYEDLQKNEELLEILYDEESYLMQKIAKFEELIEDLEKKSGTTDTLPRLKQITNDFEKQLNENQSRICDKQKVVDKQLDMMIEEEIKFIV